MANASKILLRCLGFGDLCAPAEQPVLCSFRTIAKLIPALGISPACIRIERLIALPQCEAYVIVGAARVKAPCCGFKEL